MLSTACFFCKWRQEWDYLSVTNKYNIFFIKGCWVWYYYTVANQASFPLLSLNVVIIIVDIFRESFSWSQKRQHTLTSRQSTTVSSKECSAHLELLGKCIPFNFPGKNLARTSEQRSLCKARYQTINHCNPCPRLLSHREREDLTVPWQHAGERPAVMHEVENFSWAANSSSGTWFSLPWLTSICGLCQPTAVNEQH